MSICIDCGKSFSGKVYPHGVCQGCYNYIKNGNARYELPRPGTIAFDEGGKVICHICGKSYKRLGSHAYYTHGITVEQYKEKFGICVGSKLTSKEYSQVMRKYSLDNNWAERIIISGVNTRFKKGESGARLGKEVRLQEILDKKARRYK